ncbi:MAG TPA: hypothetical protein VFK85_15725 [Anaeromyxobacteraceae bacterium]|nr:hypothetical protein [Anaeromyxobacteraceae bacterium]
MAGIMPEGEGIRRALRWLSDRRLDDPSAPRMRLIDEAATRFDLTPVEVEFLVTNWKEAAPDSPAS